MPANYVQIECPDCGAPMKPKSGKGGREFYGCSRFPSCRGQAGMHPDGSPIGTPADRLTREARRRAHDEFDPLWAELGLPRKEGYFLLSYLTGDEGAHISNYTSDQCDSLIQAIADFRALSPQEQSDRLAMAVARGKVLVALRAYCYRRHIAQARLQGVLSDFIGTATLNGLGLEQLRFLEKQVQKS